jgi:hypothetical protein
MNKEPQKSGQVFKSAFSDMNYLSQVTKYGPGTSHYRLKKIKLSWETNLKNTIKLLQKTSHGRELSSFHISFSSK